MLQSFLRFNVSKSERKVLTYIQLEILAFTAFDIIKTLRQLHAVLFIFFYNHRPGPEV